jgi:hypothetical protein
LEYWNISWWVAIVRVLKSPSSRLASCIHIFHKQAFTLGSVVWVINGFVLFLPLCNSRVLEMDAAVGWTAWLGATIFEFGSIFGIWEAWNRSDTVNFGWAVRELGGYGQIRSDLEEGLSSGDEAEPNEKGERRKQKWIWFTTDTKYFHELGFLAAFTQVWAATIFWISG